MLKFVVAACCFWVVLFIGCGCQSEPTQGGELNNPPKYSVLLVPHPLMDVTKFVWNDKISGLVYEFIIYGTQEVKEVKLPASKYYVYFYNFSEQPDKVWQRKDIAVTVEPSATYKGVAYHGLAIFE